MRRAALALALLAASTGCPPPRDAVVGCAPLASGCPGGVPSVCSPEQRWRATGRPCAELGLVCCLAPSPYGEPIHACVRPPECAP